MIKKQKIVSLVANPSYLVRAKVLGLLLATVSPVMAFLATHSAMALPAGGNAGTANVTIDYGVTAANTVTISQSDDRAVIDWSSFNLESNETAKFIVPSSTSATLNRINDSSASTIKGTVNSNGIVYFCQSQWYRF